MKAGCGSRSWLQSVNQSQDLEGLPQGGKRGQSGGNRTGRALRKSEGMAEWQGMGYGYEL